MTTYDPYLEPDDESNPAPGSGRSYFDVVRSMTQDPAVLDAVDRAEGSDGGGAVRPGEGGGSMGLPRIVHRLYAWALGYFWIPCPLCGRHFGGHEWHYPDDLSVIRKPEGGGTAICPTCTAAGLGEEPIPRIIRVNLDEIDPQT